MVFTEASHAIVVSIRLRNELSFPSILTTLVLALTWIPRTLS